MFTYLYRTYIPASIRSRIYSLFLRDLVSFYRRSKAKIKSKLRYCFYGLFPKNEKNEMYRFMSQYGLTPYPWEFTLEYTTSNSCFIEKNSGMSYILHNNKKLFFPRELSTKQIQYIYRSLIIEQDIRSAHRYVEKDYSILFDKVVLDIGGAEGIFSLEAIEFAKHIFLFECDPLWIDALNATFEPWKQKFTIVPKYVGDRDSDFETTIDTFLSKYNYSNIYLKMDIEGSELSALHGAEKTLKHKNVNMSICTYHRPTDAQKIQAYLTSLGYHTTFTNGYMYINYHFNKGVIRASKS